MRSQKVRGRSTSKRSGRTRLVADAKKARALIFLANGLLSLRELARELGVSEITAKRMIGKLRKEGKEIVSVRTGKGAYYELRDSRTWEQVKTDPLLTTLIPVQRTRVPQGKPEDADYDTD